MSPAPAHPSTHPRRPLACVWMTMATLPTHPCTPLACAFCNNTMRRQKQQDRPAACRGAWDCARNEHCIVPSGRHSSWYAASFYRASVPAGTWMRFDVRGSTKELRIKNGKWSLKSLVFGLQSFVGLFQKSAFSTFIFCGSNTGSFPSFSCFS